MIAKAHKKERWSMTAFFIVRTVAIVAFLCIAAVGQGQDTTLRLMFYNVENLFDTINDPITRDDDFTPDGKQAYDSKRYLTKQEHISKVINATFGTEAPDVIGLCEVENKEVLIDLSVRLDNGPWEIVHAHSPDGRGIDNALLFRADALKLLDRGTVRVDLGPGERPTREILWVRLKATTTKEQFVVCVNHWPSRYGGEEQSRPKRMIASKVLTTTVVNLRDEFPKAHMIAMGDFNDYPTNESVKSLADCSKSGACLTNLFAGFHGTDRGTHAYKGEWGVLDQMLVGDPAKAKKAKSVTGKDHADIVSFEWMMYKSKSDNKLYPSRTYGGPNYYGGYSDHLPVTLVYTRK